jgi:hypothetical protein
LWFFVRFFLYLRKGKCYRVVASALIGLIKTSMRLAAMPVQVKLLVFFFDESCETKILHH